MEYLTHPPVHDFLLSINMNRIAGYKTIDIFGVNHYFQLHI